MENKKSEQSEQSPLSNEKTTEKQNEKEKGAAAPKNDLTKEDLPDSSNESKGTTGSGQRQDSN